MIRDEGMVKFYRSKAWKDTRDSYMRVAGYLCENCLAKGIYQPAEIVHHIEHITPMNVTNPEVTLAHSNLRAVCRKCHAEEHEELYNRKNFRYKFEGSELKLL